MKFKYFAVMALLFATACSDKDSDDRTRFKVDETYSSVEWKGSAPTHFHRGAFKVSGTMDLDAQNKISGGTFTIPIASITNFDLSEPDKTTLLDHLKTSDFLNLALYPESSFKITKVEEYSQPGSSMNAKITGDFTLIGQTHSIS
ncbi:MAG: YceI family protein, partial [Chitinophagaceae bacterium]|nr:YceI family protein [Chitinophagaceae bacterium]